MPVVFFYKGVIQAQLLPQPCPCGVEMLHIIQHILPARITR